MPYSWRCVAGVVVMGVGGALAGVPAGTLLPPYGHAVCGVIGGVAGALVAAATFCGWRARRDRGVLASHPGARWNVGLGGFTLCVAAALLSLTGSYTAIDVALTLWFIGIFLQGCFAFDWPPPRRSPRR